MNDELTDEEVVNLELNNGIVWLSLVNPDYRRSVDASELLPIITYLHTQLAESEARVKELRGKLAEVEAYNNRLLR